jgi:glycosyltransferase involved in cell wall biosynthesis
MLIYPPDVLFIPASIMPFLGRAKTVVTLHDVAYEKYKGDLSWKGRAYQRLAAYWAKWFAAEILTVSNFSKAEIIKYYNIPANKIHVTYLGLSNAQAIPERVEVETPYLAFVGRLESKKNIAQLIRVFRAVKQTDWGKKLQLHLVGYPSRGWQEAQQLIEQYQLESDVIRHGWLNEKEKYTIIKGASVYIHLAKYEGFGFGLIEAMACNTPVIANNATSLPEIAGQAAILVDANDIESIVKAIEQVLHNQELRLSLIKAGKQRVSQFQWNKTAAETLNILTSV